MSDKHEVTVYDRVPATARVSVGQVDGYLARTGWIEGATWLGVRTWAPRQDMPTKPRRLVDFSTSIILRGNESRLSRIIDYIADCEDRPPSAVLADIAKEPA